MTCGRCLQPTGQFLATVVVTTCLLQQDSRSLNIPPAVNHNQTQHKTPQSCRRAADATRTEKVLQVRARRRKNARGNVTVQPAVLRVIRMPWSLEPRAWCDAHRAPFPQRVLPGYADFCSHIRMAGRLPVTGRATLTIEQMASIHPPLLLHAGPYSKPEPGLISPTRRTPCCWTPDLATDGRACGLGRGRGMRCEGRPPRRARFNRNTCAQVNMNGKMCT